MCDDLPPPLPNQTYPRVLPFVPTPVIRAGFGCTLAALSCVLFREILPYQNVQANALALAAQYQILITFAGAFVVLSSEFPYDHTVMGLGLVAANFLLVPFMTYLGASDMKKQEDKDKRSRLLQNNLLNDKAEDKKKFEKAWRRLSAEADGVEARVLTGAAELARRYPEKPKQLNTFEDVDALIVEAEAANEPMHIAMRELVEGVGGNYDRGPLKKKPRILEKMYADYGEREV